MRILLAIDGSEHSQAAVHSLVERAWPTDTIIDIITVTEPPKEPLLGNGSAMHRRLRYEEAKLAAKELVDDASNFLKENSKELEITTRVLTGSPAQCLITACEQLNSDLIILGSQGRNAVARFLLGSVSSKVLMHAPCSVEIAKGISVKGITDKKITDKSESEERILLPVDFSQNCRTALESTKSLPWHENSRFALLVILPPLAGLMDDFYISESDIKEKEIECEEARLRALKALDALKADMEKSLKGNIIETFVLQGDSREKILEKAASWSASLLIMGSQGRTGLSRLMLGSVSHAVAMHAPCSVRVIK